VAVASGLALPRPRLVVTFPLLRFDFAETIGERTFMHYLSIGFEDSGAASWAIAWMLGGNAFLVVIQVSSVVKEKVTEASGQVSSTVKERVATLRPDQRAAAAAEGAAKPEVSGNPVDTAQQEPHETVSGTGPVAGEPAGTSERDQLKTGEEAQVGDSKPGARTEGSREEAGGAAGPGSGEGAGDRGQSGSEAGSSAAEGLSAWEQAQKVGRLDCPSATSLCTSIR
jgi:hypothetical protein